jgi:hypothetical protein
MLSPLVVLLRLGLPICTWCEHPLLIASAVVKAKHMCVANGPGALEVSKLENFGGSDIFCIVALALP